MDEIITLNEVQNDGKSIYLYFNGLVGLYTAYGYSAYLLSRELTTTAAFSDSMQMPIVVINALHVDDLAKKLKVIKHEKGYYQLAVEDALDSSAYNKWAKQLRQGLAIVDDDEK